MFGTHSQFFRVKCTRDENSVHHFCKSVGVLSEVPDCFVCFRTKISGRVTRLLGSYSPFTPPVCQPYAQAVFAHMCAHTRAHDLLVWSQTHETGVTILSSPFVNLKQLQRSALSDDQLCRVYYQEGIKREQGRHVFSGISEVPYVAYLESPESVSGASELLP